MTGWWPMRENAQGRWTEHGNGAPVILVHRIPTSRRLWRHVMPLVRGRCLAWKYRAKAQASLKVPTRISVFRRPGYLLESIGSVDLDKKPVLAGHDLCGGVAQIMEQQKKSDGHQDPKKQGPKKDAIAGFVKGVAQAVGLKVGQWC